jgi:hypothetical protein
VGPSTGQQRQGAGVALSADGTTMIVGAPQDNSNVGAAFVWTWTNGAWTQQGPKLVGSDCFGACQMGTAVAISADGNTAVVGGPFDSTELGAAWVWTRTGGAWTQSAKLVGGGAFTPAHEGATVAISADATTVLIGGPLQNSSVGGVWVFTKNGAAWAQQGSKLLASDAVGPAVGQGSRVALSADGNTAIIGGPGDNNGRGAAWIWTRSGGVWTQQGSKLVGTGNTGSQPRQGSAVAISNDGNTAIVGGAFDDAAIGATWVFTRTGNVWSQQGPKLVGAGAVKASGPPDVLQGAALALSGDGNTALIAGPDDNDNGAVWLWHRSASGVWEPQGLKLVPNDNVGNGRFGSSVALAANNHVAAIGGSSDNNNIGATWVYRRASDFAMVIDSPTAGSLVGSNVTLAGWTIDRNAGPADGSGIDSVHVWAYPSVGAPFFAGIATVGISRPDIGNVYGPSFTTAGYSLHISGLAPGAYTLVAYPHGAISQQFGPPTTVAISVPNTLPQMSLDTPIQSSVLGSTSFAVSGWAFDGAAASGVGIDAVHVWAFPIDGGSATFVGAAALGGSRADVANAYGAQFNNTGFSLMATLASGTYQLVAYAHVASTGRFDISQTVAITVAPMSVPVMAVDAPMTSSVVSSGGFMIAGWAIDRGATADSGVDGVHVWAFPTNGAPAVFVGIAGRNARPDVAGVYGGNFVNAGFTLIGALPPGTYTMVVYAHSSVTLTFNQSRVIPNVVVQ